MQSRVERETIFSLVDGMEGSRKLLNKKSAKKKCKKILQSHTHPPYSAVRGRTSRKRAKN